VHKSEYGRDPRVGGGHSYSWGGGGGMMVARGGHMGMGMGIPPCGGVDEHGGIRLHEHGVGVTHDLSSLPWVQQAMMA
jgi:hypothetical protein